MDPTRFPADYSVLLSGPPGVGKFEFIVSQLREAKRAGERTVFVTLDLPPREIRARANNLGVDLEPIEGRTFVFVDCYSATSAERLETASEKRVYTVSSFSNLEGIGMALSKASQELGTPVRIFFYTVSSLYLHNSAAAIAKFFQIVTGRVKANMGFILYAVQDGVHDPMTMNLLRSLVDGVVEMRFTDSLDREYRLHHMRGFRADPSWRPFVEMPGPAGGLP